MIGASRVSSTLLTATTTRGSNHNTMAETVTTIETILQVLQAIVEKRKELKLLEEEAGDYIDLANDVYKLLLTTKGADVSRYTNEALAYLMAAAQERLSVVEECTRDGWKNKVVFTRGNLRKLKKATNSLKAAQSRAEFQTQGEILKKCDLSEVALDHGLQQDLLEEGLDDEARQLGRLSDIFHQYKSAASVLVGLDTSGSMSDHVTSNETRLDLAKENIADLLDTFCVARTYQ